MSEQVWVLPRTVLFEVVPEFQGFLPANCVPEGHSLRAFGHQLAGCSSNGGNSNGGEFASRDEVEEDPTRKQVIPYVAIQCGDRFLTLERLPKQGEARLHGKLSIGVGGHVNPEPPEGEKTLLERGMWRELREELWLGSHDSAPELLGFINDDSNAVGQVHFGVAAILKVSEPVEIRETDRMRGDWRSLAELKQVEQRLESWSAFLLPHL